MEDEALVARRRLALGPCQGVFLVGLRMQEHRKVLAHRRVAAREHVLGRRADDDPVAILDFQPEQFIADGAADAEDLH